MLDNYGHGDVGHDADQKPDHERNRWGAVAADWSDPSKARHNAVHDIDGVRTPLAPPREHKPHKPRCARGNVGVDGDDGSIATRAQGRAGIEPEPAEPEHGAANHGQRHRVRLECVRERNLAPLSQIERRDDSSGACGCVHGDAARKVEDATLLEPAVTPDPVRDGEVHGAGPRKHKEQEALERESLGKGARDKERGNVLEHHLIERIQRGRNRGGTRKALAHRHVAEEHRVEVPDESALIGTESQRESADEEQNREHNNAGKDLHHDREHRAGLQEPRLEERQPRNHQKHERHRHRHERRVAAVLHAFDESSRIDRSHG
eukprot:Amastigsp_a511378_210.p2 type:complete len:320 gc:universal Amastigsp_a511378_210:707-1666(+)